MINVAVMGFRVLIEAEEEQSKHALTVTMATATTAEAALSFHCFNSFCELLNLWQVDDINGKKKITIGFIKEYYSSNKRGLCTNHSFSCS